ncbi:hypothetical protein [Agrobacterium larrymoorei]|uniref:hypothetical protein n=1 Tax=Agrobacterium larrymoorei TaxID=160699 RepID=UPI0030C60E1D
MTATPEMIAAAWSTWHKRHGGKLGPGPAFVEAINAALAAQKLSITDELRTEIDRMAKHFDTSPQQVLRRMVFSYATNLGLRTPPEYDGENVTSIRGREISAVNSGNNGEK